MILEKTYKHIGKVNKEIYAKISENTQNVYTKTWRNMHKDIEKI